MLLNRIFKRRPFKYLSTAEDYAGIVRGITRDDRIVLILNNLQKNLDSMESVTKKEREDSQRLLSDLYKHCKGMSERIKFLEEKLYDQHYK